MSERSRPSESLPLKKHLVLATSDRELALEAAKASISPMHVEFASSRSPFQFCVSATIAGGLGLRALEQEVKGGFRAFVEPTRDCYTLEFALEGLTSVQHRRKYFSVSHGGCGVITSPNEATEWTDFGNPYRAMSVALDKGAIEAKFRALTGRDQVHGIVFDPLIDTRSPSGRSFLSLISGLYEAVEDNNSILDHQLNAAAAEDLIVTSLLTSFDHSHTHLLDLQVASGNSRALRAAMEYLEAHSEEVLAVDHVANAVGISIRSLQRTFRELKGMSPTQYLREVRLEKARARLSDPYSNEAVTDVALGCGFSHLGAFSVEYKRKYGESPSETRLSAKRYK